METFADIKKKVRLLSKNYDVSQLSEAHLEDYINTFYIYDFPQIIQVSDLQKNMSFCTTPYVDKYSTTDNTYILNNLTDFRDFVIVTDRPVYISGQEVQLFQSQEEFYKTYTKTKQLGNMGVGDGIITNFTYTLPTKVLHNSVILGSLNTVGEALIVEDLPNTDAAGREANAGTLRDQQDNNIGTINYITGAIDVTFPSAPADGETITYEMVPFRESIPNGLLFFDNSFTLRPVPDKVYEVKLQVRVQPAILVNDADTPLVKQWAQFLAYGAAIKILQDRSDEETASRLIQEFKRQKILVTRKTSLNKSKDRSQTIFAGSQNVTDKWYYYG